MLLDILGHLELVGVDAPVAAVELERRIALARAVRVSQPDQQPVLDDGPVMDALPGARFRLYSAAVTW